jgi:hypothetical protein
MQEAFKTVGVHFVAPIDPKVKEGIKEAAEEALKGIQFVTKR